MKSPRRIHTDFRTGPVYKIRTGVFHFTLAALILGSAAASATEREARCQIRSSLQLSEEEKTILGQKLFDVSPDLSSSQDSDLFLEESQNDRALSLKTRIGGSENLPHQEILLWKGQYDNPSSLARFLKDGSRPGIFKKIPDCASLPGKLRWQSYFQVIGSEARKRVNRSYQTSKKQEGLTGLVTRAEALIQYGPRGPGYEQALAYYRSRMGKIEQDLKNAADQSRSFEFEPLLDDLRKALIPHLKSYCSGAPPTPEQRRDPQFKPLVFNHPYLLSSFWGPDQCGNCVAQTLMVVSLFNDHDLLTEGKWKLGIQLFEDHIQAVYWNPEENTVIEILSGRKSKVFRASIYSPELISFAMSLRSGLAVDRERDSGMLLRWIDIGQISFMPAAMRFLDIFETPGDWSRSTFGYLKLNRSLSYDSKTDPPSRAEVEFQPIHESDQIERPEDESQASGTGSKQKSAEQAAKISENVKERLLDQLEKAGEKNSDGKDSTPPAEQKEALEKLADGLKTKQDQQAAEILLGKMSPADLTPETLAQIGRQFAQNPAKTVLFTRCFDNCRVFVTPPEVRIASADEQGKFLPDMNVFTEPLMGPRSPEKVERPDGSIVLTPSLRLVFRSASDMSKFLASNFEDSVEAMMGPPLLMAKKAAATRPYQNLIQNMGSFHSIASQNQQDRADQLKMFRLVTGYLGLAKRLALHVLYTKEWKYEPRDRESHFPSAANDQLLISMRQAQDQLNSPASFKNLDLLSEEDIVGAFRVYSEVAEGILQVPQDPRGGMVSEEAIAHAPLSPSLGLLRYLLIHKIKLDMSLKPAQVVRPEQLVFAEVENPEANRTERPSEDHKTFEKESSPQENATLRVSPEWVAGLFMSLSPKELQHPLAQWAALQYWTKEVQPAYRKHFSSTRSENFRAVWSWALALTLASETRSYLPLKSPSLRGASSLTMSWDKSSTPASLVDSEISLPDPGQPVPDFIRDDLQAALSRHFKGPVQFRWGVRHIKPLAPKYDGPLANRMMQEFGPAPGAPSLFSQDELDLLSQTRPDLMIYWSQRRLVLDKFEGPTNIQVETFLDLLGGREILIFTNPEKPNNDRIEEISYGAAG